MPRDNDPPNFTPGDRTRAFDALTQPANGEIEQLRVQLAGCLTAAEGHGAGCKMGDYGWSLAFEITRALRRDRDRLRSWVDDLQSGMYVNCVYCGHRYGPETETPTSMADVLKEHIATCPKHPMAKAVADISVLRGVLVTATIRLNQTPYPAVTEMVVEMQQVLDATIPEHGT